MGEECEARRRADTILVQISAPNAEQACTIRAVQVPLEVSEDAETVEDGPEAGTPARHHRSAKRSCGRTKAAQLVASHSRRLGANRVIQHQKNLRPGRGVARLDLWWLASGGLLAVAFSDTRLTAIVGVVLGAVVGIIFVLIWAHQSL